MMKGLAYADQMELYDSAQIHVLPMVVKACTMPGHNDSLGLGLAATHTSRVIVAARRRTTATRMWHTGINRPPYGWRIDVTN